MFDLTALVQGLGGTARRPVRIASSPRVTVGGGCVLRCSGCTAATDRQTMDIDAARHAFGVIRPVSSTVLLAGGDPLTRSDLRDTVEAAREAGLEVELLTPGVLVSARRARELKLLGIARLRVALDSFRYDLSDSLRSAAVGMWAGLEVDLQLDLGPEGLAGLRDRVGGVAELAVRRVIVSSRGCRAPVGPWAPWTGAQVMRAMLVDAAARGSSAASVCVEGAEFDDRLLLEAMSAVGGRAAARRAAARLDAQSACAALPEVL